MKKFAALLTAIVGSGFSGYIASIDGSLLIGLLCYSAGCSASLYLYSESVKSGQGKGMS